MSCEKAFGLYVHVPYCRTICPYCDFNVVRHRSPPWPALGRAMAAELSARAGAYPGEVRSLYVGGGTPSLAPVAWLLQLLADVRARWPVARDAEVTLELEPGTMGEADLAALRRGGFNRVSMGWQSTHDRLLRTLGRGHDAAAAQNALAAARAAGFTNVSLDLMYAVPGQTEADLEADLAAVLAAAPDHVSLYNLTVHPGTPFGRQHARKALLLPPEELEVAMLERACAALPAAGYARYEVANFARPGARAVHNAGYWAHVPYLGVGPGAHSFWREAFARGLRWENVRAPGAYLRAWGEGARTGDAPAQATPLGLPVPNDPTTSFVEHLTPAQLMLERMLLGLRTLAGVCCDEPQLRPFAQRVEAGARRLHARGWAERRGTQLCPTPLGLRHADAAAALFV